MKPSDHNLGQVMNYSSGCFLWRRNTGITYSSVWYGTFTSDILVIILLLCYKHGNFLVVYTLSSIPVATNLEMLNSLLNEYLSWSDTVEMFSLISVGCIMFLPEVNSGSTLVIAYRTKGNGVPVWITLMFTFNSHSTKLFCHNTLVWSYEELQLWCQKLLRTFVMRGDGGGLGLLCAQRFILQERILWQICEET